MYHYTYKITNLINNKIYYGVRSCKCLPEKDIKYLGSGIAIKNAYKKYGIENFNKKVDEVFESRDEANLYEAEIVDEEWIERKDTYNLKIGGLNGCGYKHTEEVKIKIGQASLGNSYALGYNHTEDAKMKIRQASLGKSYGLGYKHTEDAKMKISTAMKGEKNPMYGKKHTQRVRDIISKKNTGFKMTEEQLSKMPQANKGENSCIYGKKHSKESIEKMANIKCKRNYIITTPTGDEIITNNLKQFCRENNLDDGHMYKVLRGKRKHHKKYTVKFKQ